MKASAAVSVLGFCGRHGTALLAGGLFIGVAVPPLAALFRPLLGTSVFLLTAATMLAVDWPALRLHLRRPGRLAVALAWIMGGAPVLVAAALRLAPLPGPLVKGLVLWAAAPPLIAVPAIAALLGLDSSLALLLWAAGTFLMPLTLPPLVLGLIGVRLDIGLLYFMGRLGVFVGGAALLAATARWAVGPARIAAHRVEVAGLNVFLLLVFAVAVMDGMTQRLLGEPLTVLLYAAAAVAESLALQGATFLVLGRMERQSALTACLVAGNHNLAIVWATLGPDDAADLILFLAIVQLPIFVLPALMRRVYRRLGATPRNTSPGDG